ncbi:uncharacterized protein [Typha latifolia]|uniref:uncharacterized protein isoform X2 n=1 Tax=Typha latifolia TaxID=4733 RepID=UPI003C2D942A
MLEATERINTSSSIRFVPRQVMLESHSVAAMEEGKERRKDKESKKEMKKEKKSRKRLSDTIEEVKEEPEILALDRANGGAVVGKGKGRETLLQAIAAFLKSNGFSKTLTAFQSEAQIEVDGRVSSFLKLEDLFSRFLDTSNCLPIASIDCQKQQDSGKVAISREAEGENINDASTQTHKKKKRRNNEADNETKNDTSKSSTNHISEDELEKSKASGDNTDSKKLKAVEFSHGETEKKKEKKHKSASNSLSENSVHTQQVVNCGGVGNVDQVTLLPKLQENDKKKKSKKHKIVVDPCNEANEPGDCGKLKEIVDDTVDEVKSLVNNSLESIADHKHGKKKKKLTENIEETETHKDVRSKKSCDLKFNDNALDNNDSTNREKKKKKVKSSSENSSALISDKRDAGASPNDKGEENVPVVDNVVDIVEKKIPKKRKRFPSEENGSQVYNDVAGKDSNVQYEGAENNKEAGAIPEADKLIHENKHKKRKVEESDESNKTPAKDSSGANYVSKELAGHKLENGHLENNGKEGNTSLKACGKGKNSSEPKTTINAFQRVKVEEVKFADEKLQDNSYWAKGGADSGYGAKAQGILGQVRGRDFRHEKTKKKRGTYRGGQIDLQSHSVKFNYSDEE